jgi:ABC-type uncharacterized transport system ATPase subunit
MTAFLQTKAVGKTYGGVVAVDRIDMTVEEQELVCIIGPNGAGKSTFIGMISGTIAPSRGEVSLAGRDMTGRRVHEFCRAGIVRKFQGTNVFKWLSVRDNLMIAGLAIAGHAHKPPPDQEEILDLIRLRPQADLAAQAISHGQRQWLEFGMALMCGPKLLLLDEPTAGMTVEDTRELARLLGELRARCAIVVIEHDLAFVRSLACRTLVMHQGALIREGSFHDIEQDREIRDIYLGRSKRHASR